MSYTMRPIESLEFRTLLSGVQPSVYEQYMVELYNWARANPSAAAAKYGVALNEGIAAGTISTAAKQPVAISPLLVDASRTFAQWMIDHDEFGHYVDGSDPQSRMQAAGYTFGGSWEWGENLAMRSSSGSINATTTVAQEFADLYIDAGIAGRGHRTNIFNASWKEIGSGVATGIYDGWNALISAQDFAFSGSATYLTGVAYNDTSHDSFYTPGEQLGNVLVTAIRNSDSAKFSTATWASGGYSLALPAGTYTVYAGGGSLGGYVRYDNVVIGAQNVKRDFRPDLVNSTTGPGAGTTNATPSLVNGVLTIASTSNADTFAISVASGTLRVVRNGTTLRYTASAVKQIILSAGDGNDTITLDASVSVPTSLRGGNGNDSIKGGSGADIIRGDDGIDTLFSGAGNDKVYGSAGDDFINGETGSDRIWGGADNDLLFGGSHSDILYGEAGVDTLFGQNQNDTLDGGAGADFMSGGADLDTVDYSTRTAALVIALSTDASIGLGSSGEAGEQDKVISDVENINGGTGADRITGSSLANLIHGNGGNDTIYALGGADTIFGDAGRDRLVTNDGLKDVINGGTDRDTVTGDAIDVLTAVEVH
jgi:Ca2+-binding RTX toxin-like protein